MRIKGYILYIISIFLFISCETLSPPHQKNINEDMREVYQKELKYIKARFDNDLDALYSFQHPEYKAIIDMDRFKSSGGTIQLDYSSVTEKDPHPRIYIPFKQIHFILYNIKVKKAYIDKSRRYAKFHTIHLMNMFFPMAGGMPVRREMEGVDYWEKFNGEWVFLNKVRPDPFYSSHISGAAAKTPINLPNQEAEYYIEIPIKEIENEVR